MASDYQLFDAEGYNQLSFPAPGIINNSAHGDFMLKCLARHYTVTMSSVPPNSLKILDYGCGGSIGMNISAASKASELVLADFAKTSRAYVRKWLDRDSTASSFWFPFFKYVTQTLEGGSERDSAEREEMLRDRIKAVVECDISKDEFIQDAMSKISVFDVVLSSLCLEVGCKDLASYKKGIEKLASLIKDGGYLLLCSTRREHTEKGFYICNGVKYTDIALKKDFIVDALKQNGLCIADEDYSPVPLTDMQDIEGFLFFAARKCTKMD